MPDQSQKPRLADYLQEREYDAHISVEEEDSVRADWWRASCIVHDWSTTGSKPNVEDAAAGHVAERHLPCEAPSPRTFIGTPLHCHLLPGHDGDHQNGGYTWPRSVQPRATCSTRARWFQTGAIMTCVLPPGHEGLHVNEQGTRWNFKFEMRPTPSADLTIPIPRPTATAAEPEPPSKEPFRCPLASCDRRLDDPPPPAEWMLLVKSFGIDVRTLQSLTYLRDHLETHSVIDFVTEISRLTQLCDALKAQIPPAERAWADRTTTTEG